MMLDLMLLGLQCKKLKPGGGNTPGNDIVNDDGLDGGTIFAILFGLSILGYCFGGMLYVS